MSSIFNAIYAFWNQIIYAVAGMRIPFDIIDILLMAYIIYKAIGFLRETRAGQLAKGLVIFVVIYFVANWWNLTTMKWILSRFVDYIIIAIAIIFQPELRRALEYMGRSQLMGIRNLSALTALRLNPIRLRIVLIRSAARRESCRKAKRAHL